MDKLRRERKVFVADLADILAVTQETVRRDLEKLETQGLLQRSHGGAVLVAPGSEDLSFTRRMAENYAQKQRIAKKAAGLVADGSSLMVDSSSTVLALFELLRGKKGLMVVTNSVKLLHDYAGSELALISSGGTLRSHSLSLVGAAACRNLATYSVDFAIFSCKGLDREYGVSEPNEREAAVKQVMAGQARNRVLLADHSKFDQRVLAKTLDFRDLDYVVTDVEPEVEWLEVFEKNKIQLIC